jgi:hypothetical protein
MVRGRIVDSRREEDRMPIRYQVDHERRVVFTEGSGTFSDADVSWGSGSATTRHANGPLLPERAVAYLQRAVPS